MFSLLSCVTVLSRMSSITKKKEKRSLFYTMYLILIQKRKRLNPLSQRPCRLNISVITHPDCAMKPVSL